MTRRGTLRLVPIIIVLLAPLAGHASIWISEIHYNPEGSDTDAEWIEVHNTGSEEVVLSDYSFREQGTNHRIEVHDDSDAGLDADSYAVIADAPAVFLSLHPQYSGRLYDSSFSLRNTGEELSLLDAQDQTVFSVTYDPATGGDGNGHSIGLIDDVWYEVSSSPGAANTPAPADSTTKEEKQAAGQEDETDTVQDQDQDQDTDTQEDLADAPTAPATYLELDDDYDIEQIRVDAGGSRTVMAGSHYRFRGKVYGLEGGVITDPTARWNWGDGQTSIGATAVHRYRYPGSYTLTFSAHVLEHSDVDRVEVTVIPPALTLVLHPDNNQVVGIRNDSQYHLEVSRYSLVSSAGGNREYRLPDYSYVNAGNTMYLDEETLGFSIEDSQELVLRDGEGESITRINIAQARLEQQINQTKHQSDQQTQTEESKSNKEASQSAQSPPVPQKSQAAGTHSMVYLTAEQAEAASQVSTSTSAGANADSGAARLPTYEASGEATVYRALSTESTNWHVYALAMILGALAVAYLHYRREHLQPNAELSDEYSITDQSIAEDKKS